MHRRRLARSARLAGAVVMPALLAGPTLAGTPTLPADFHLVDAYPTATFDLPVQVIFLPDGRSMVAEKDGRVWMIAADGTKHTEPFLDLTSEALSSIDLGLLSVAADPDFLTTPWVYVLYTVDPDGDGQDDEDDAFSRLERYQESATTPNVADLSTRDILIGETWPDGIPALSVSHTIGTLRFGADGSLLVSSGDGAHPHEGVDAGGRDPAAFGPGRTDPAEDIGAFRSRSLNSLAGKILRVDKETGLGLPDNPYWDGDGASKRSRVWVYGLRNPYRFTVRPGTGSAMEPGALYISDVGWSDYEELCVAPSGGINFGWPCYEGIQFQPSYDGVTAVETGNTNVLCDAPPNAEVPDDETPPIVHYHHWSPTISNPEGWTGNCATGGAFYTGDQYPASFHDRFFMIDYTERWIRTIEVDAQESLVAWSDFATDFSSPLTNLESHPDHGDLFLIQTWSNAIWRLYYGSITDVDAPTIADRPFHLGVPAPNPSAGGILLPISLPESATVTLDVFRPDGRRVATRELEGPRGESRVRWDGIGTDGRAVEPGVYLVRLVTPWGADAKKLVIHER